MRLLFLYLKAFSFTGGIEKFNRSFLKAMYDLSMDHDLDVYASSVYDSYAHEMYFPSLRFKGFGGNRIVFTIITISTAWHYNLLVLGHINLALVGYWIKKIKPSIKLIIIAHGLEVWGEQKGYKRKALESADRILSVSNFTKQKMIESNPSVSKDKISIFPNTLDPYFVPPKVFHKPQYLLNRYQLSLEDKVLLTITRISSFEKYKGYDNVIRCLHRLSKVNLKIRYLLCGKADEYEQERLHKIIQETNSASLVTMTGFIQEDELIDHYLLADVFVMQSKMEGFGIVFIEALACGRKVIAGSKDGSVDALLNGELGLLIDPDSEEELKAAILQSLNMSDDPGKLQSRVIDAFGFDAYKERLRFFLNLSKHVNPK